MHVTVFRTDLLCKVPTRSTEKVYDPSQSKHHNLSESCVVHILILMYSILNVCKKIKLGLLEVSIPLELQAKCRISCYN